jgi:hypothetical protein
MTNEQTTVPGSAAAKLLVVVAMTVAFLRRLFCRHRRLSWVRNVYGDEIILCGYRRTVMRCDYCGKSIYHPRYITREMCRSCHPAHEAQRAGG